MLNLLQKEDFKFTSLNLLYYFTSKTFLYNYLKKTRQIFHSFVFF